MFLMSQNEEVLSQNEMIVRVAQSGVIDRRDDRIHFKQCYFKYIF